MSNWSIYEISPNPDFPISLQQENQNLHVFEVQRQIEEIYNLIQLEEFDTALDQLHSLDTKSDQILSSIKSILTAFILSRNHEVEELKPIIDRLDPEKIGSVFYQLIFKISKANLFLNQHQLTTCKSEFYAILDTDKIEMYPFLKAYASIQYARTLTELHELRSSLPYYLQAMKLFQDLDNQKQIISSLNNLAMTMIGLQDYTSAIDYLKDALGKNQLLGLREVHSAMLRLNLGLAYMKMGKLSDALVHFQFARDVFEAHQITNNLIMAMGNIGVVYELKGLFDEAETAFLRTLELSINHHDMKTELFTRNNLALLYTKLQKYEEAESYLSIAYGKLKQWKDLQIAVSVIGNLSVLYTQLEEYNKASQYIKELKELDQIESDDIKFKVKYFEAKFYISSYRLTHRGRGISIILDLLQSNEGDVELRADLLITYSDFLLDEYRQTGVEEILNEIEENLSTLSSLGLEKNSITTLIQSLVLKSELYLFQGKYDQSSKLLQRSLEISKEYGLDSYYHFISKHQDQFYSKMIQIEQEISDNQDLLGDLEFKDFEQLIHQMITSNISKMELEQANPIMLLLLSEHGTSLCSIIFNTEFEKVPDQVIAGYLSTISSAMGEAFHNEGMIERIEHQSYSILLRSFDNFILCYILDGTTFLAREKMNEFITQFKHYTDYDQMVKNLNMGKKTTDVDEFFNQLATDIFLEK